LENTFLGLNGETSAKLIEIWSGAEGRKLTRKKGGVGWRELVSVSFGDARNWL
jgi:hypothetical protein